MRGQLISDIRMHGTFFGEHLTVRREICEHTQIDRLRISDVFPASDSRKYVCREKKKISEKHQELGFKFWCKIVNTYEIYK